MGSSALDILWSEYFHAELVFFLISAMLFSQRILAHFCFLPIAKITSPGTNTLGPMRPIILKASWRSTILVSLWHEATVFSQ